jgi:hypothetical protein
MLAPADANSYLNAIADARHELRGYKIRRNLLVISIVFFALWALTFMTAGGLSAATDLFNHRDMGGLFGGAIVFGIAGTFLSGVLLACLFDRNQYRSLPKELRAAEQRYEVALAYADKAALKKNLKAELKDQEEMRDTASGPIYGDIARSEIVRIRKAIRELEES